MKGKTYTLPVVPCDSDDYFHRIEVLTDKFLDEIPDEGKLLNRIQHSSKKSSGLLARLTGENRLPSSLIRTLKSSLSRYTADTASHLRSLPLSDRFDRTLRTTDRQYHLYMLEIELTNRINRESFSRAEYKIALIPHCLRDYHDHCRMVPGDVEATCSHCNEECFVHLGSLMLENYGIKPHISVSMDHDTLFKKLKTEHPNMGVLGIACIPELVEGMRLCRKLDIPAMGVPLDVNRCQRWLGRTLESSFNLKALKKLL